MKVKYLPTGGIWESKDEMTVEQWKRHPELYDPVSESSTSPHDIKLDKPAARRKEKPVE